MPEDRPDPPNSQGMTLVEVLIAVSFLAVGLLGLLLTITSALTLNQVNREETLALNAAREKVSEMQNADEFSNIYGIYSVAPDETFEVDGLPDSVGTIIFPESGGVLMEDIDDPELGMPRDLNGDTTTDTGDRSGDFGDDAPHFSYREEITEVTDMEDIFKVRVVIALAGGELVKEFSVETYLYREKL